jgi:hypothetical protein
MKHNIVQHYQLIIRVKYIVVTNTIFKKVITVEKFQNKKSNYNPIFIHKKEIRNETESIVNTDF